MGRMGWKVQQIKYTRTCPRFFVLGILIKMYFLSVKESFGRKKHGKPFTVLGGISYSHQPLKYLMNVGKNSKTAMIMMILDIASITSRTNGLSQVRLNGLLQLGQTSIVILILQSLQGKLKYLESFLRISTFSVSFREFQ